jgi:Flp pilus assembly protein TadG
MSGKGPAMPSLPVASTAARRRRKCRGNVLVELSLVAPWIFFLFVGIVDMGFYSYSLIAVENAARIAAEYTSQSSLVADDQDGACTAVKAELSNLPNVVGSSTCNAAPLIVTADDGAGPDGGAATSVSVTYQSISMIPIPGLLMSKLNVTRKVQMRVKP